MSNQTRELSLHRKVYLSCPGAYREEETPSSISNLEAKLLIADDTAPFGGGKVGRRRAKKITILSVFHISYSYFPFIEFNLAVCLNPLLFLSPVCIKRKYYSLLNFKLTYYLISFYRYSAIILLL